MSTNELKKEQKTDSNGSMKRSSSVDDKKLIIHVIKARNLDSVDSNGFSKKRKKKIPFHFSKKKNILKNFFFFFIMMKFFFFIF